MIVERLFKDFTIDGFRAVIVKNSYLGHLCGYIGLPEDHPLHGKHYDDPAVPHEVHGGWTYSKNHVPHEKPDGRWYFGFDCAHAGDLVPAMGSRGLEDKGDVYRDIEFVERELRKALPHLNGDPMPAEFTP